MSSGVAELDFIEELKMRRWARENYVPPDKRSRSWHPVVREEMEKKDHEVDLPLVSSGYRWNSN